MIDIFTIGNIIYFNIPYYAYSTIPEGISKLLKYDNKTGFVTFRAYYSIFDSVMNIEGKKDLINLKDEFTIFKNYVYGTLLSNISYTGTLNDIINKLDCVLNVSNKSIVLKKTITRVYKKNEIIANNDEFLIQGIPQIGARVLNRPNPIIGFLGNFNFKTMQFNGTLTQ